MYVYTTLQPNTNQPQHSSWIEPHFIYLTIIYSDVCGLRCDSGRRLRFHRYNFAVTEAHLVVRIIPLIRMGGAQSSAQTRHTASQQCIHRHASPCICVWTKLYHFSFPFHLYLIKYIWLSL